MPSSVVSDGFWCIFGSAFTLAAIVNEMTLLITTSRLYLQSLCCSRWLFMQSRSCRARSVMLITVPTYHTVYGCDCDYVFVMQYIIHYVWWPRELNVLQIQITTCKLTKQLPQFDNAHAANAHNTTKKETSYKKCVCLCCEHLHHLLSN